MKGDIRFVIFYEPDKEQDFQHATMRHRPYDVINDVFDAKRKIVKILALDASGNKPLECTIGLHDGKLALGLPGGIWLNDDNV